MLHADKKSDDVKSYDFLDCTGHACDPSAPVQQVQYGNQLLSPKAHRLLMLRNCAVIFAAVLFCLSLLLVTVGQNLSFRLKAVAYFIGAAAYGCEFLMLTDCCRHKPAHREMLMPNVFGIMYIILGISYFNH